MGIWTNSNVIPNKCVKIMALNTNQLQVTTITAQANAIIEQSQKVVNDIRLIEVWIKEKYLDSNDFLNFIKSLLIG
jgi:hypothetical protein